MYEQLPVPFGLVRFGVAPDHPEVKNCQDRFTEIAGSPRFNFIGNVGIGKNLTLAQMKPHYDAILFAYGASKDRQLAIPGENLGGIHSARAFVGWYNGLPEYADLSPDLESGDTAMVIGQGNVALDIARVLLSGVDHLKHTDITASALDTLSRSRIRRVHVVGRRGPLQASFTIKEVRELMQMPKVAFRPIPSHLLPTEIKALDRRAKRITDLLKKQSSVSTPLYSSNEWSLDYLLSPKQFRGSPQVSSVLFDRNEYIDEKGSHEKTARVKPTGEEVEIDTSLVFRSIGYKSEPLPGMNDLGIVFDHKAGVVSNDLGRVLSAEGSIPGLYCTGWVKNGPTGTIASTMEDAFASAEQIVQDWGSNSSRVHGWDALRHSVPDAVDWKAWSSIDSQERQRGSARGKEREKYTRIEHMIEASRPAPSVS
ncbi:MAG: NADPH-adrenodoxin reductase [Stictis urceolatum]|nr:NADPH-adrenodoxin reductase [Stictis urceolata]